MREQEPVKVAASRLVAPVPVLAVPTPESVAPFGPSSVLPRSCAERTSENPLHPKFRELAFYEVG